MRPAPSLRPAYEPDHPSARSDIAIWFRRGAGAALGVLVVLLIAMGLVAAGRAVLLVFIALLLGAALEPLVGSLRGRLGLPRAVAILFVYLAFIAIGAGVALLVVPGTLAQADQLGAAVPTALRNARDWASSLTPLGHLAVPGDCEPPGRRRDRRFGGRLHRRPRRGRPGGGPRAAAGSQPAGDAGDGGCRACGSAPAGRGASGNEPGDWRPTSLSLLPCAAAASGSPSGPAGERQSPKCQRSPSSAGIW